MQTKISHRHESRTAATIDAAWLIIAARILLGLSLFTSLLVLIAWPAGWTSLRSIIEGLPTMKANTAVGLTLLSAAGLLRTIVTHSSRRLQLLSQLCALLAITLGIANLTQDLLTIDLGINTLLCDDPASIAIGEIPGQMSTGTSLGIALLGVGTLLCRGKLKSIGIGATILGGAIGILGVAMFLSRASGLRDIPLFSTTAIHTALLLWTIAVSILLVSRGLRFAQKDVGNASLRNEFRRAQPLIFVVTVTLLVGFLVTAFFVRDSQKHISDANRAQFLRRSELLTLEIQRRVNICVYGLNGARGMYTGSQFVNRDEFAAYVFSRNLPKEFPGAIGFGMIQRVERDDIDSFVATERSDNAPEFMVRSLGAASVAYIIQHIYPLEDNRAAWGYDIGSESVRRNAIEKAIRSGDPTITGMIHLRQDDVMRAGFLYFVPIYKNGTNPQTPAERETNLAGVLYAPIILERSLDYMGDLLDDGLDFEIFDGDKATQRTPLYDHDRHLDQFVDIESAKAAYARRMFFHSSPIMVGGRTWTIVTSTTAPFHAQVDRVTPAALGLGGATLSLLLAGIIWSMGLSQTRAMALAEDMTQELRASEKIATQSAEEAERLAKIIRRTSNGVIITDIDGKIEWINDGFTRISGYQLEEALGKSPRDLLYGPNSNLDAIARLEDAFRLQAPTNSEIVNYAKDGREYVVATEIAPLLDTSGTLTGFMMIENDITEKCAAEARLKAVNAELMLAHQDAERASKIKSEFLANMSHEIRTPMTAIVGFSDLLLEQGMSEEEKRKSVGTIQRNGNHLLELINDILDLSKVESGKFDIELRDMDPTEVIRDVHELLNERAITQENRLQIELKGALPQTIHSDSTRLKQALFNLVGNAIKFTQNGVVKVIAECDFAHEQMIFQVIDSGIGMSPEQLEQIFQPFRQADASTTRKFGGTGLGLTITKQIAELLGGDVRVESQSGVGSSFTLRVATGDLTKTPLRSSRDNAAAESQSVAAASTVDIEGRILFVEDGPDNRKLISFILRKAGADVTIAENGKLGLEAALHAWRAGTPFDVILMDMQMPVMDGYTATAQLRDAGYTGQIIALTAHAMRGDINKCLEAGCDAYLTKPIERKSFLTEVGARIRRNALQANAAAPEKS
ncbi:CHASE domain-containing protein [Blastopirellula marina]|uniref:histidine kinase n=1 Tax=Blastopirellula marina DSM 3645 TaxID=314230 RepID=A3ZNN1_9BACT|nr:CHASE domain-containing protein [Blastopirellula marina]EAQ81926.1 sensory transduction histidine kinase [Blastopirellula marina DSM 3645]